jgi:hypothetical protein
MKKDLIDQLINLDNDESYIAGKSINELDGPYHSRFSAHLRNMHGKDYERIWNEIHKNNRLNINDVSLVLETLYLLIYEMSDGDFLALYDDVTKEDVKALYKKLEKIHNQYILSRRRQHKSSAFCIQYAQ